MILFRDWLRSHESDRRLYEDAKRSLAARPWTDKQAKSGAAQAILAGAQASLNHIGSLP